jgi:hypothetical protein
VIERRLHRVSKESPHFKLFYANFNCHIISNRFAIGADAVT